MDYTFILPGEGMCELSLADRATIANMSPEYGATMGFFPVDHVTLHYLRLTGRSDETVSIFFFQKMHEIVMLMSLSLFAYQFPI